MTASGKIITVCLGNANILGFDIKYTDEFLLALNILKMLYVFTSNFTP